MRVVEVLPLLKTRRFDLALTYAVPGGMDVRLGNTVRVPLGARVVQAVVVAAVREEEARKGIRAIEEVLDAGEAFDAEGVALARWLSARYLCSFAEALGCVVPPGALPRTFEHLSLVGEEPKPSASVPERLIRLLWDDLREGFSLQALLRHPEARRAGDRGALLHAISTLVRAGSLIRQRRFERARITARLERVLELGDGAGGGARTNALIEFVRSQGIVRRADATLAGFSSAVIARAIAAGAIVERNIPAASLQRMHRSYVSEFTPTAEQTTAIARIDEFVESGTFGEVLLHGVTGSGKTLVYLSTIAEVLERGGRALVLVPEISLTPQTARRFEAAFGERVAVLHSGLSDRERYEAWQAARRGDVDVVVGARSAVFAPLRNLRLIVVDEAHERTYKQESAPRYHAVEVARRRALELGATLVLGSATPSMEAYDAVCAGRIACVRLEQRATQMPMPKVHIVDLGQEFVRGNRRIFSTQLVEAIAERLRRKEKTILFINRRGSARFALCRACGHVPTCVRCSVSLTVHRAENLLRCHLCDYREILPSTCPRCKGPLREFGTGTQRVVESLGELFPHARVVRMDGDTTTRIGAHARLLDEFAQVGDILVGTQMVTKGLDFADVTLVGVIAADGDLHIPDFRAAERTFDLIAQVVGRSGRSKYGEAIVQTYSPNAPAIRCAAAHDYETFAAQELRDRRELAYPPAGDLAYLAVIGPVLVAVKESAQRYATALRELPDAEVLGPAPFVPAKVNDQWRYRIAVKIPDGERLRDHLRAEILPLARVDRRTRLVIDIDP
jgi:primosomal protein N' (replication factor Y)